MAQTQMEADLLAYLTCYVFILVPSFAVGVGDISINSKDFFSTTHI